MQRKLEIFKSEEPQFTASQAHPDGPLIDGAGNLKQFKKIVVKTPMGMVRLASTAPDNCGKIGERVCIILNIVERAGVHGIVYKTFQNSSDMYAYPCKSSLIGEMVCSGLENDLKFSPISAIRGKYVCLPDGANYIVIPLRHFH